MENLAWCHADQCAATRRFDKARAGGSRTFPKPLYLTVVYGASSSCASLARRAVAFFLLPIPTVMSPNTVRARAIRRAKGDAGFTLGEILASAAIITVAIVGLLSSSAVGLSSVDNARRSSTALFLANRRLEAIKTFSMSTAGTQGFTNVTGGNFPAENYKTITINGVSYGNYRTTTTITDNPGGLANTKLVRVSAFYKDTGVGNERSVQVSTFLVWR
jgi:Tfp pilus assembly protein PilV